MTMSTIQQGEQASEYVYRIRLARYGGGSFVDREQYYEPRRLTLAERRRLTAAGWAIAETRVRVAAEVQRLSGLSVGYARADADARGASSACHGYALGAAIADSRVEAVISAAAGRGSLREAE